MWTFQRISASFQLTPSRRATKEIFADAVSASISTHALTEGDYPLPAIRSHQHHFNSRPHGGRRGFRHHFAALHSHFNSRPHGGRHQNCSSNRLSIHFNSRPHGGRRSMQVLNTATQTFQLTPSRRATMAASIKKIRPGNFNSRPHGGRL